MNELTDNMRGVNKVIIFNEANEGRPEMKIQNLLILVML